MNRFIALAVWAIALARYAVMTFHFQPTVPRSQLKQLPAYLNRWDSQQARNEGVFAH